MKNLITCLVVCVLSGATFATTWTIADDGKADFDNIQAAIDASSDGDEIIVMPGTYTSTANEVVDMRGKEIWLHSSAGAEVTIIDGEQTRRGIMCGSQETSNTIIEGFTITNGFAKNGGGMNNFISSPTLTSCTFEGNYAYNSGGGMYNWDSSSPTLINCTLCSNTPNQIWGPWSDEGGNTVAAICPVPGACCTNDHCLVSEQEKCLAFFGQWQGEGTTCEDNPCPTSCLGDVTGDGQVDVTDILVVISVWGACP
jgi:parallel beta-helix repeat protein